MPKMRRSTMFDAIFADKRVSYVSEAFQYPTHLGRCQKGRRPLFILSPAGAKKAAQMRRLLFRDQLLTS